MLYGLVTRPKFGIKLFISILVNNVIIKKNIANLAS